MLPQGPTTRREDADLLSGKARFVADDLPPGCLVATFVRSTVAHAVIRGVDLDEARAAPGVIAAFAAGDLGLPPLPEGMLPPAKPRPALARPCLATDRVRFVGEAVAVVVAERLELAVDAAEAVTLDLEVLDAVVDAEEAASSPTLLFPEHGSNLVLDFPPDADAGVDTAPVVVRATFVNQRVAPVPLETNAVLAVPGGDWDLEVRLSTQAPFRARDALAGALGLAPEAVRVIAPAVGGGFGAKGGLYPEEVVVAAAALRLGRPVVWQETRSENLLAMTHGRAQTQHVELAAGADGVLVGLRTRTVTNVGAYPWRGVISTRTSRNMASGVYRLPRIEQRSQAVVTNTTPLGPYRGAGRPEAAALIERAMDLLAAELKLDPAEIRRRNFVPPEAFPYTTATGAVYDTGEYAEVLDRVLELGRYQEARAEQAARRRAGDTMAMGVGLSTFVEVSGGGWEFGAVRVERDGSVTVLSGGSPHGQGHETTFAQVAARLLQVPLEAVRVRHSDTAVVPRGFGTFGSRSAQMAGSAIHNAGEAVLSQARDLAAELLEAAPEDVVLADGKLAVAGVPSRSLSWADLAVAAADRDGALAAEADFAAVDGGTYPFGAHLAVVDVDTETGLVRLRRLAAVDDCGRVLNPVLVEGQVHGGLAQGVGQALFEGVVYDQDGTPLTGNLITYGIPGPADLPSWDVAKTETPTPRNPLGAKGVGEAGTVGSTVAVQNAVIDALRPFGVRHLDLPLSPQRVWEALRAERRGPSAPGREPGSGLP